MGLTGCDGLFVGLRRIIFNELGDIESLPRAAGLNRDPLINQWCKYNLNHRVDIGMVAG